VPRNDILMEEMNQSAIANKSTLFLTQYCLIPSIFRLTSAIRTIQTVNLAGIIITIQSMWALLKASSLKQTLNGTHTRRRTFLIAGGVYKSGEPFADSGFSRTSIFRDLGDGSDFSDFIGAVVNPRKNVSSNQNSWNQVCINIIEEWNRSYKASTITCIHAFKKAFFPAVSWIHLLHWILCDCTSCFMRPRGLPIVYEQRQIYSPKISQHWSLSANPKHGYIKHNSSSSYRQRITSERTVTEIYAEWLA
jgi:hypothetical protein